MRELENIKFFIDPLTALDLEYFVTGSIASIIYGEPRLTHDLDLVLALDSAVAAKTARRLIEAFPPDAFYCPPTEVIVTEARREDRGHFNLIHHATGFKADIYLKGNHPFHDWAFARRHAIALPDATRLWVAPVEYVIVRKLEFYREGGSEKHLRDIRSILSVSANKIDRNQLLQWIKRYGLDDIWSQARNFTRE